MTHASSDRWRLGEPVSAFILYSLLLIAEVKKKKEEQSCGRVAMPADSRGWPLRNLSPEFRRRVDVTMREDQSREETSPLKCRLPANVRLFSEPLRSWRRAPSPNLSGCITKPAPVDKSDASPSGRRERKHFECLQYRGLRVIWARGVETIKSVTCCHLIWNASRLCCIVSWSIKKINK